MAATLGATLGAPLTAIVFAFGLTHDANALLPLLAATLVAHGFATIVMKRSIMTEKIARRGYHIYREYGVDPLERHDVAEVMTSADALVAIDGATPLDAVESQYFGAKQTHRAYPVVQNGRLLGLVDRATLDAHRAQAGPDASIASAFADRAPAVAQAHETCRVVASRLAMLGLERLPVVDDPQSLRVTGIVSRSDLIKPALQHFDDEQKRERFRPIVPVNLRDIGARKAG
jgi:CBS domain-containing protein